MMKIKIDENFFALPKSIILGNSGEVSSRKIKVEQPVVKGAQYYLVRFSVPTVPYETIFEAEIIDGILTVPAIVLYEMGSGYIQWIARSNNGQLIAKSDLISYSVLRSIGDELSPIPSVEDTNSAIERIKDAAQEAIDKIKEIISSMVSSEIIDKTLTISDKAADAKVTGDRFAELTNTIKDISSSISGGNIQEIADARTGSITSEEFPSLSERLESDFSYLKKVMRAVDVISSYIEISIEECGEDVEAVISADETLRISGTGSINERAFEKREDFSTLIIDIGGDVGMGAFGGCENLSEITVNCNKINSKAFWACTRLHWLNIGKSVSEIGSGIISNSAFYIPSGVRVMYDGTMEEWNAITKAADWIGDQVTVENNVVVCSDGEVEV